MPRNGIGEGATVYTTKLLLCGYALGKSRVKCERRVRPLGSGESGSGIVRANWDEKTRELHDSWCGCGESAVGAPPVDRLFPPDKVWPINVRPLSHFVATDQTEGTSGDSTHLYVHPHVCTPRVRAYPLENRGIRGSDLLNVATRRRRREIWGNVVS